MSGRVWSSCDVRLLDEVVSAVVCVVQRTKEKWMRWKGTVCMVPDRIELYDMYL